MPLQDWMKLVSVDDHAIETADVWTSRVPKKYGDAIPHVEEVEVDNVKLQLNATAHGRIQLWVYGGKQYPSIGLNAVAGKDPRTWDVEPARFDDMRPGCYDPVARLADMDADGVWAHLCFPSFPRFAGTRSLEGEDRELALDCVRAWNDWMLEEWCGTAPDRYVPVCILPIWDVDLAVAELQRAVALGARCISFPENCSPLGLPSFHTDHWDPLFAAAQDADMPLMMHFGTSQRTPFVSPDAPSPVVVSQMGLNSMSATSDLLLSPTFHKFPRLKVALAEGGTGWIPYMLERIDQVWERHRWYSGVDVEKRPSELFATNMWGCFITDQAGFDLRLRIGVDRLTYESDYPHSDSLWPHSRKHLAEALVDVPDDEAHRIVELNACALLSWRPWADQA
jgi:predicted TIM-barrel fold metal-dependent hydrolase